MSVGIKLQFLQNHASCIGENIADIKGPNTICGKAVLVPWLWVPWEWVKFFLKKKKKPPKTRCCICIYLKFKIGKAFIPLHNQFLEANVKERVEDFVTS